MKSRQFYPVAVAGLFLFQIVGSGNVLAAELDAASVDATNQTTHLLKSSPDREKAIAADPQAQSIDQMVRSVGGTAATTDEIYGLSSDVFESLVKETGGDPMKMQEIIQKANQDPKGFYSKYFSEANKAKLQDLSKSVSGAPAMAREPASIKH